MEKVEEIIHRSIKGREVSIEANVTTGKYAKKEMSIKISLPLEDTADLKTILQTLATDVAAAINVTLPFLKIPKEEEEY